MSMSSFTTHVDAPGSLTMRTLQSMLEDMKSDLTQIENTIDYYKSQIEEDEPKAKRKREQIEEIEKLFKNGLEEFIERHAA